jgi:hypothetical protein
MPHQGQRAVMRHPARFKWLSAGRRWRKTTLAMITSVTAAMKGRSVFWGSNTYAQSRIGWDETRKAAWQVADFAASRMEALFPTGGKIIFRSLDNPDNARGYTADGVVVDEASLVVPGAWYEVLRPVVSDTGGWALFIGTPKGRNWFYQEYVAALDAADSMAWQIPTLGVEIRDGRLYRKPHPLENPDFRFAEAEAMFHSMPERTFRQEFLAEFIEDAGAVFRRVTEAATATPKEVGLGTYIGVDWGKHEDFTVLTVLDDKGAMVAMDRFNQIDYAVQAGRLAAMAKRYNPQAILAELNAMGEPIVEQLQRQGLPVVGFQTTNASKTGIIESLALAFEKGDIRILPDQVLVNELQAYEMTRLPSGATRYSAPDGLHDDCVMSLALAWRAWQELSAPSISVEDY